MAVNLDPMTVGTIIGAVIIALISGGYLGKKSTENKVRIANNPLDVHVREQYVSRQECIACKNDMKEDVREMRVLFDKAVTLIQERDDKLSNRIHEVDERELEGRRRIHDRLLLLNDQVSRIDARTDVSKAVGKLGGAILALANKKETA